MKNLEQLLFIDIETVPCFPDYEMLSVDFQKLWERKAQFFKINNDEKVCASKLYSEKAGVYAEFAKVVCIGLGCLIKQEERWIFTQKVLANADENILLNEFVELLTRFEKRINKLKFCGHNIKEFDIPFLCRRMVIHNIPLPNCMSLSGKKPWEIEHEDTMELWSFGDRKNYTSLALLAASLGIPSSKSDMDGSQVGQVFWKDNDLKRIGIYCLADVIVTAKIYLKIKGLGTIIEEVRQID